MSNKTVQIGNRVVGDNQPCYVIAEIGINHNGDLGVAKKLIDVAVLSGCDAVKFQKRTPELCVPPEQRNLTRGSVAKLSAFSEWKKCRVECSERKF